MTRGIGIIGAGWGVRIQAPALRAAGLEVTALAGRDAAKTARLAAEHSIPWSTGDWRELIARPDVDLVSIVTPPNTHRAFAIAALEAGKHTLCEKPTAMDAAEAQAMLAAAEARPQQLALIDHELRFLPAIRQARRIIAEGGIGAVRHAELHLIASSRADRQRPWNWWSDKSQGGGVLGAISSHQIDLLRYLLHDEIDLARGLLHTFVAERPTGPESVAPVSSDDFATFHLRFTRGAIAVVVASMIARTDESNRLVIYGDAGTLRFADGRLFHAAPKSAFQDITPPHTSRAAEEMQASYADYAPATVYLGQALLAALNGDRDAIAPAATFADGLRNQQALDAIRRSHDAGWQAV